MGHTSSDFELQHEGEILWCHIRRRLQQIIQFDEEWIIDTPRSETLWAETCKQNGIPRSECAKSKAARAADGPVGFAWWGWQLPQYVEIVPTPKDGIWMLRASVKMCIVRQDLRAKVLDLIYGCQSFALGGAFVLGDDSILRMVFALSLSTGTPEEATQFAAGLLHRQVAYAGYIAALLEKAGMASLVLNDHPVSGPRRQPDEFVMNLFEGTPSAQPALDSRHPSGPEGLCLTRIFSPELPSLVEKAVGWRYRPTIGDSGEAVFSNDANEDPCTYFTYLPIEDTQGLGKAVIGDNFPFKTDPLLRVRLQIGDSKTVHYATRLEALNAANAAVWASWAGASSDILGCFCIGESSIGFYVGQAFILWPAASLPGPRPAIAWVDALRRVYCHALNQATESLAYTDTVDQEDHDAVSWDEVAEALYFAPLELLSTPPAIEEVSEGIDFYSNGALVEVRPSSYSSEDGTDFMIVDLTTDVAEVEFCTESVEYVASINRSLPTSLAVVSDGQILLRLKMRLSPTGRSLLRQLGVVTMLQAYFGGLIKSALANHKPDWLISVTSDWHPEHTPDGQAAGSISLNLEENGQWFYDVWSALRDDLNNAMLKTTDLAPGFGNHEVQHYNSVPPDIAIAFMDEDVRTFRSLGYGVYTVVRLLPPLNMYNNIHAEAQRLKEMFSPENINYYNLWMLEMPCSVFGALKGDNIENLGLRVETWLPVEAVSSQKSIKEQTVFCLSNWAAHASRAPFVLHSALSNKQQ